MLLRTLGFILIALTAGCTRGAPANDQGSATAQVPAAPARAAGTDAPAAAATTTAAPASAQGAAAASASAEAPAGAENATPRTPAECKSSCNGTWGRHGLAPKESCNCRTSDGGKRCRDGNECEGHCVADENPELEVTEKGPPALGYLVGRCSDTKLVFGCRRFIRDGASSARPRDLSKLPPKLCVD